MPIRFRSKPGLVVYLTCGDPDIDTTREVALAAIDAGADVIELGVPFSDPVADGPVIQRASERALAQGTTLGHVLELGSDLRRQRSDAGIVVFSYLNPILRMGMEDFCDAAKTAGIDGALLTDLTLEEAEDYSARMRSCGLSTIFLAAPTSSDDRLKRISGASSGFVYAVSRTGITGAQHAVDSDAAKLVKRLRKWTKLPIAVGFGISNAAQFREAGKFADAVVIGSAIVKIVEDAGRRNAARAVGEFVRGLRSS